MDGRSLLLKRVEATSISQVADELGYSRTAISLVVGDKYTGSPDRIHAKALEVYGGWDCGYLGKAIAPDECAKVALAPAPTGNPARMRHWSTCQSCPFRPNGHET
jgi:hypothetical protein